MTKHSKALACDADHGGRTGFAGAAVLRRSLGWGACALLVGALAFAAAGCGGGSSGGGGTSTAKGLELPTSIGKGEGALNLIEWPYYSDPSFAKKFESETGCKIHRKDAGSSNQMVALMRAGGGGGGGQWDLVSASGDASLRLITGGDVQAVNVDLIPQWKNFIPIFKGPAHNTVNGVHYGVSLQWGPNVLLYRTDKIKTPIDNWGALYDPKHKGQITIPNNPIQIADAAFYLMHSKADLGIKDPYELNKKQFDATVALLKQQRPLVKLYWNYDTDGRAAFANGDVSLGAIWPVDTLALQAKNVPVKEVIPADGATGWADTWMLAKKAPHPNCAYKWMKYVSTPQVQAKQALVFGETPVNPKACPFMNKIQAGSCAKYHLNEPLDYYDTIKFWKTPTSQCNDGKNDCMDYNAWQKAWTEITG
jgi:putative spermidine/putrescine transport system substrate-binding protein